MANEQNRDGAAGSDREEPFRESGSGEEYNPNANWAAERRLDNPSGGTVPGMEGAPSGAGDGGFGPEGDYGGAPNANVAGQADADRGGLADQAQQLGRPKPGRATIGASEADRSDVRGDRRPNE